MLANRRENHNPRLVRLILKWVSQFQSLVVSINRCVHHPSACAGTILFYPSAGDKTVIFFQHVTLIIVIINVESSLGYIHRRTIPLSQPSLI